MIDENEVLQIPEVDDEGPDAVMCPAPLDASTLCLKYEIPVCPNT